MQLFHEHKLVATHARAQRPGQRLSSSAHFPPEKLRYFMQHPAWCRQRAAEIGPSTALFIERLLGDKVLDRLRGAQATLRLADTVGAQRLEAACARALACEAVAFVTVKTMLQRGLEQQPLPGAAPAPKPSAPPRYARCFADLFNPADPATTAPKGNDPWSIN